MNLTEKEIAEGSQLLWTTPKEAFDLIEGCLDTLQGSPYDKYESLYASEFIIHRDKNILKYYIQQLENNKTY